MTNNVMTDCSKCFKKTSEYYTPKTCLFYQKPTCLHSSFNKNCIFCIQDFSNKKYNNCSMKFCKICWDSFFEDPLNNLRCPKCLIEYEVEKVLMTTTLS